MEEARRDVVERLATALDSDDYRSAGAVLAQDLVYQVGGKVLVGPEAAIDSYRSASTQARTLFDKVHYDHEIIETDGSTFRVKYLDILFIGDDRLVHNAEQLVTVDPDLEVVRIINVDVPGERENVDEFLAEHGRSR